MQKCFEAISRSSSRHASRTAVWLWLSEVEKLGPVQPLLKGKIMFRNGRWFSCKSWKQPADPDDVLKTADDNGYNVPFALVVLELPLHQRFCHWILQQKGLYIHAGFWYSTTKWKLCYGAPSQGVACVALTFFIQFALPFLSRWQTPVRMHVSDRIKTCWPILTRKSLG